MNQPLIPDQLTPKMTCRFCKGEMTDPEDLKNQAHLSCEELNYEVMEQEHEALLHSNPT